MREFDYTKLELGENAIRWHLGILQDVSVIAELVVEPDDHVRGYPYKFYRLTEQARELFDRNDLFPANAWWRQYARVEKPTKSPNSRKFPAPMTRC
ncbi:hypothetical protein SAMN06264867_1176 [Halorubrum cibi]|uniref:Uncharacterized protein n=1 Tax=Halorubrum cibi TaxID=413815 RepID=A0A521F375_9EURY|nr:hypothetical protein SAMN06264867_1176 [Halorubrum cibi]